jgi:hypothetical protein
MLCSIKWASGGRLHVINKAVRQSKGKGSPHTDTRSHPRGARRHVQLYCNPAVTGTRTRKSSDCVVQSQSDAATRAQWRLSIDDAFGPRSCRARLIRLRGVLGRCPDRCLERQGHWGSPT